MAALGIRGERILAEEARERKQRFGSDRGKVNQAIDHTVDNRKKKLEAEKALESAAQTEAKPIVEKMMAEGSYTVVNGRHSTYQSGLKLAQLQQKLVKRQHMSNDGKRFTQTIDWMASIPVIEDIVYPERKYVNHVRASGVYRPGE